MMKFLALTLALCFAAATAHAAPAIVFDGTTVGLPVSGKPAELFLPRGAGPFPAMVVLPGCAGLGPHDRNWARRLRDWGYAAMVIDSYRPRGFTEVCNHGMDLPGIVQAQDALHAATYLRHRPDIRADRIGVIGFSHGGWAVIRAVLSGTVAADRATAFAAAIAFYPGCPPATSPLATDTLILIGEADDWTPADKCRQFAAQTDRAGHALDIRLYPGALHGFDANTPAHDYAGHHLGGDPPAAADAIAATRQFLGQRLLP